MTGSVGASVVINLENLMRIAASPELIKTVAHRLGVIAPALTLAQRIEVMSKTMGYQDWHQARSSPMEVSKESLVPSTPYEFDGASYFVDEPDFEEMIERFLGALETVAGETAIVGDGLLGAGAEEDFIAARILSCIGALRPQEYPPKSWGLPPAEKNASPFYKRMSNDIFEAFDQRGFLAEFEGGDISILDPQNENIHGICLDAYEVGMEDAKPLTIKSLDRFGQELSNTANGICAQREGLRIARRTEVLQARSGDDDLLIGACLLDVTAASLADEPLVILEIAVRACLSQSEDMEFSLGEAAHLLVKETVEALRVAALGSKQYQIVLRLTGRTESESRAANRERAAMRSILIHIQERIADDLNALLADADNLCGLFIEPIDPKWRARPDDGKYYELK